MLSSLFLFDIFVNGGNVKFLKSIRYLYFFSSEYHLKVITVYPSISGPPDCDKLCAEADLLLAKSHEKEKDGDLVMAALLCDSAAGKWFFSFIQIFIDRLYLSNSR